MALRTQKLDNTGIKGSYSVRRPTGTNTRTRALLPDASHLSGLFELHLDSHSLQNFVTLANVENVSAAAEGASQAAASGAASDAGPLDALAKLFESALTAIDGGLEKLSVPYSYGFAIIILTFLVKVATYPLTQKQVASTLAVQALAPSVKELQAKYANDPERLQLETARLYKEANVNPLAGCLPTLATIPVFIGLYRALTLAAQDGLLKEGFFFIPSLGGPATIEQQLSGQGLSWLFPFVNGAPPLGWEDTAKYLILPVALVLSQYASMSISQPANTDDPTVKQTQAILRYLPILIGYFSLNVPSGLTIYWLTNNILTTGQQLYLKKVTVIETPKPRGTIVNDPVIDVEASTPGSATGARRSKKGETFRARQAKERSDNIAKNPRGKKRGKKFAERRVKEKSGKDVVTTIAAESASQSAPETSESTPTTAVKAVAGEVVLEAPAAVGKPSTDVAPSQAKDENGSNAKASQQT